ncbi:MAG: NAD(P)/FAD-dependent oxidoreductase [Arcobacteraceae bacterium]|nr:NAD(P)/FAD-dependent oxidoreductase [Arcobacteraceae bacterium]
MNKNINIIGSGASGLISAIILSKKGFKVTIFEKNSKVGRKILATGNGKCNISNQNLSLDNFHSTINTFPTYAISQFNYKTFETFFSNLGLVLIQGDGTKVYPMSLQASSVTDILYNEAIANGVEFIFNSFIQDIKYQNNLYEIFFENKRYISSVLIIATGSCAMKKLGSSNSGYDIAKQFKHKIIEPFASLVQLVSEDKDIHRLSGVKVNSTVKLFIDNKQMQTKSGDVLFTNYGVSGNAILDISRNCSYSLLKNKKVKLSVDIIPDIDKNKFIKILENRKKLLPNKEINFLLESMINKKLIPFIFNRVKIPTIKQYIEQLTKKDLINIVYHLKNIQINIKDTKGFENAEVVAGGIDVMDIDNKTMQSKLQKDLYFCGEVMDVDGECGGYNLHWAWASGYIMANSIKL